MANLDEQAAKLDALAVVAKAARFDVANPPLPAPRTKRSYSKVLMVQFYSNESGVHRHAPHRLLGALSTNASHRHEKARDAFATRAFGHRQSSGRLVPSFLGRCFTIDAIVSIA